MPIHEAKTYEAWCDQCGRRTQYTAANRTEIEGGWTVTKGKTLADVRVLCPMCSEIERMEEAHE